VPATAIAPELADPLTGDQHRELAAAKKSAKKIHRAAKVASFNGWTLAAAAVVSAPFALGSTTGVLVTLGLAMVALNEFHGRRRLLRFESSAASYLGWNQLLLLAMLVGYSAWMLWSSLTGDNSLAMQLEAEPELREALGSLDGFEELYGSVVVAVYGSVIVASILFQGLNALYYFTRRKHLEAYVAATPDWALEVLRD
jgi:hypothetical protein